MEFDWDPAKAASNLAKHGVAFDTMDEFDWGTALVFASLGRAEPRLGALGVIGIRLHFVVYSVERRATRIISLRKANSREVKLYASES